jgi:uroporphyrinogen decarboxylase
MTPRERLFRRLNAEPVDRIPNLNIVMTFAARAIGVPYSRYVRDHRALVEGNLAVCERFGIDLLSAISDPYRETADLGAAVLFPQDDVPKCVDPLIKDYTDIQKISVKDPSQGPRMSDRLSAVELLRREAGDRYPVMGWVEGAFAEANDLRGMSELMTDLYEAPAFVEELLELCLQQAVAFATAQVRAGADIIGIGDAAASLVSPRTYESLVLGYEQRLINAIHAAGAKVKLHICGNTSKLLPAMAQTGADIIDVDWMVDFAEAVRAMPHAAVCGNFDPVAVLLRGTQEQVRTAVARCAAAGNTRTMIAAGCEVPRDTPEANLLAVAEALKQSLTME